MVRSRTTRRIEIRPHIRLRGGRWRVIDWNWPVENLDLYKKAKAFAHELNRKLEEAQK